MGTRTGTALEGPFAITCYRVIDLDTDQGG